MKSTIKIGMLAIVGIAASLIIAAKPFAPPADVGETAPGFTLKASNGKDVSLSDFKGKYVVLEWWNYQCPFVQKHYDSGNMQKLQKELTKKGVVWLIICSSAQGKQGYVTAEKANELMKSYSMGQTAILLDPAGDVGHAYKAKTSPQMFLITPKGKLVYDGAIDSIKSTNKADIAKAENYLLRAYNEVINGKEVSKPKTQPYGCTVKYAKKG